MNLQISGFTDAWSYRFPDLQMPEAIEEKIEEKIKEKRRRGKR